MTALQSGLELTAAALRWLRERRIVITRRRNIYDDIDLTVVNLMPKDNDKLVRNLMSRISPDLRDESP